MLVPYLSLVATQNLIRQDLERLSRMATGSIRGWGSQ